MPLLQNTLRYTNPVEVITEILTALLNANLHVYHVSPVLTLIEDCVRIILIT